MVTLPALVGRAEERAALRSAVADAAAGGPGLVLVHGEAGIGKTWLAREAAEQARADGHHVLIGQCLRFGANVTSYLPFSRAFEQWLRSGGSNTVAAGGAGTLNDLMPSLVRSSNGVGILEIGRVLDRMQMDRPTVVVVDDLQWADPSSLDVLTYVVAGFAAGQRLVVLATYRDTDLEDGHPLHGWLADADRMPGVRHLSLDRMDVVDVEALVLSHARSEGEARASLADEVLRRSQGNPYLADLLLRHSDGAPPGGGARLEEALLGSWHRLSGAGRRLTQLLALAGAPTFQVVLEELGRGFDLTPAEVATAEREASGEGITVRTDTGALWFRHPLLAETIASTVNPRLTTTIHTDLAAAWALADRVSPRDRANALALHHLAAGNTREAFDWSLRASDEAESIRSWREASDHLSTAVRLVGDLPAEVLGNEGRIDLLCRAARTCEYAGDDRGAVRHSEAALAAIDRSVEPRRAARLMLHLQTVRGDAGYSLSTVEPLEVIALTGPEPLCPERALALAHLAYAEVFTGAPEAAEHAEAAVRTAAGLDDAEAKIWALGARSQTRWGTEESVDEARRALAAAEATGDPRLIRRFAIFASNSLQSVGLHADAASTTDRCYRSLRDSGQLDYAASVGALAARWHFLLGEWGQTRELVRVLLATARGRERAGSARCIAAVLAAHEGHLAAADLHILRARELLTNARALDALVDAEVLVSIAAERPLAALETIEHWMVEALTVDPMAADQLLEYASRALLVASRDGRGAPEAALQSYRRIERARGTQPQPFAPAGPEDVVQPALGTLHAAQRAQALRAEADLTGLWQRACEATKLAGMRHEQARALQCLARHLLLNRIDRRRAADALATARDLATDLAAAPLLRHIDDLSRQAHISVTSGQIPQGGSIDAVVPAEPPLTPRERDVLAGLLAGQTYAEIAQRLFITDKTVSTHVSHVLRKTGTANRIELAALAQRAERERD